MAHITKRNPRLKRSIKRNSSFLDPKKSFLIVCEGKNTEPDYFNAFRLTSAVVKASGEGINTIKLVYKAIKIRDNYKNKGRRFDNHWVVFDKDDFLDADFNNAITLAKNSGFQVAYSNQAFEYWFLLHFNKYEGLINRADYANMLSKLLGFSYSKDKGIASKVYNHILKLQPKAISNAHDVLASFGAKNPAKAESSTTVHLLVESLNRYL